VNEIVAVDVAASGCAMTLYFPAMQFGVQVTFAIPFASVIANELDSAGAPSPLKPAVPLPAYVVMRIGEERRKRSLRNGLR
jgi:hypothetical protein